MNRIGLIGLLEMIVPGHTARLCDGGFIVFGGQTYLSADPVFGTIGGVDGLSEGIGEEVPALDLVWLPPESSPVESLVQPGFQTGQVRFWIGEFSAETATLIGTPDLQFHGQIDQTTLSVSRGRRELAMTIVSTAERLFDRNRATRSTRSGTNRCGRARPGTTTPPG